MIFKITSRNGYIYETLLIKQIQISTLTANILKNTELLILYPSKSHNIYVKL